MLRAIFILLFSLGLEMVFAQSEVKSCEILSKTTILKLFTDSLKRHVGIIYPIRIVYKCMDKSGKFFIVLTESNDIVSADNDTLNYRIKAFKLSQSKAGFIKKWEINDFVTHQANYEDVKNAMESSIWFWTKYCEFVDIDKDGLIDPIITYGTGAMNYTSDGRIKMLVFYKGQKVAIRHQNGVLDFERNTQVDEGFYSLPINIQENVKRIMRTMSDNHHAIFPADWQNAMNKHKLKFDER